MSNEKSCASTSINWFPGHMAKTRRQITEDLKMIDVVVEILDARIPDSSQNPDIRQITQNKKKVIVLNKYDLSDKNKTEKWIEYFTRKGQKVVLADSLTGKGINETTRQIQKIMEDDILELTEVAYTLTKFILENYRSNLLQRYSLNEEQINKILNQEQAENENIYEIMQLIGKKRGAILGGKVDDERTSKLILDDFRSGKLGNITLEMPK